MMQLGAALPLIDIGGEPATVRAFAEAAEDAGYDHLAAPDHVLGVNVASRPGWGDRNTSADLFHDPFVLFGFLSACTSRIGFATEVLILSQRQTALVAKQAASLDVLSGGRFRLGIGLGWNEVEFVALGEDFHDRGKRSEEQVAVMQALWAEPHVTFAGRWHKIEDAGINPLPPGRRIPIWFGGHQDVTLRRIARLGEGWVMLAYPPDQTALAEFAKLRRYAEAEGRDPGAIGIEVWVSTGAGDEQDWRAEFRFWKAAGVSHVTLNNAYGRNHHRRIAGRTLAAHLAALRRYRDAVGDLA
ncbi:MAG: LLM class F420-dependent oxidoreductase [Acetobacteraceae bacterium]